MAHQDRFSSADRLSRGQGKSPLVTAWDLYAANNAFRFLLNFSVLGWLTLICLFFSNNLASMPNQQNLFGNLPVPALFRPAAAPAPRAADSVGEAGVSDAGRPAQPGADASSLLAEVLDAAHADAPASPRLADYKIPLAALADAPAASRAVLMAAVSSYNNGGVGVALGRGAADQVSDSTAVTLVQGLAALGGGRPDQVEAGMLLLARAAQAGSPAAMAVYGLAQISPPAALPADPAKGREWLTRAADAGDAQAAALLAKAYLNGAAGFVDRSKAQDLLREASQQGDTDAGLRLAALIVHDKGAEGVAESEQLLRVTADKGDLRAQSALGRYLARSAATGLVAGYDEAIVWLNRAAEGGDVQAMASLGDVHLYLAKSAPAQDPSQGVAWYERCARAGLPICHYQLGRSYRLALGAALDLPSAWAHMSIASDHSVPKAADELRQIEQQMTPSQRADGVRLLTKIKAA